LIDTVHRTLSCETVRWLLVLSLWLSHSVMADTIHLRNGQKIHGNISGISGSSVTIQTGSGSRLFPRGSIARISYGPWTPEQEEREKREEERKKKEELEKQRKAKEEAARKREAYEAELLRARKERERVAAERARQEEEKKRLALLEKERIARQAEELARARKKQEEEALLVQEKVEEVRESVPGAETVGAIGKQEAELGRQTEEILRPPPKTAIEEGKETEKPAEKLTEKTEVAQEERAQAFRILPFLAPGLARWESGKKTSGLALSGSTAFLLGYSFLSYRTYQSYEAAYQRPLVPLLLLQADQGFLLNYLYFRNRRAELTSQANRLNTGLSLLSAIYAFNAYDVYTGNYGAVSLELHPAAGKAGLAWRFSF